MATPQGAPPGPLPPPAAPVEAKRELADNYFYNVADLKAETAQPHPYELPDDYCSIYHSFGFDSKKRYNIHYLNKHLLLAGVGNTVQLLDFESQAQTYIHGMNTAGVGATAVHPTQKYFAVGEKGIHPHLLVYEYPSLKLYRVLRNGTEEAYSNISFNKTGNLLASVGSHPDYMLTVWDWQKESIILRTKAFSQEVFRIGFSPTNDGILHSSGMGHIKFWQMARTFTGLKLQGAIGKFGKVQLSDVAAFVELPSGKVLTGTESGSLLLWDSTLIQLEVCRGDNKPCHNGMIEVLHLEQGRIYTGGMDGFIRVWEYAVLAEADVTGAGSFVMEPIEETLVEKGVQIKTMIRGDNHWIIQDAEGGLWRFDSKTKTSKRLAAFHAGAITGLDACPVDHFAASCGEDGTVRLYDYVNKTLISTHKFASGATTLVWASQAVDDTGRTVVVGFADGSFRALVRCQDGFKVVQVWKPHEKPLTALCFSPNGGILATASKDATLFFFDVRRNYTPLGFVHVGGPIKCAAFNADGANMLVCQDGGAMEIVTVPDFARADTTLSFELHAERTPWVFTRPPEPEAVTEAPAEDAVAGEVDKKEGEDEDARFKNMVMDEEGNIIHLDDAPKEAPAEKAPEVAPTAEKTGTEEEEAPPEPSAAVAVVFVGKDQFYVSFDGALSGKLYLCTLSMPEPITFYELHKQPCQTLRLSSSGAYLLSGANDGSVRMRRMGEPLAPQYYQAIHHDGEYGHVTAVCLAHDDGFLMSAGRDGSLFVLRVASEANTKLAGGLIVPRIADETLGQGLVDNTDGKKYSIQEEKLKREEDRRLDAAEIKKNAMRAELEVIRAEFQRLLAENSRRKADEQLPRGSFVVDPELRAMLQAENDAMELNARREMEWSAAQQQLRVEKLKARFINDVLYEKALVASLHGPGLGGMTTLDGTDAAPRARPFDVSTFRVMAFSEEQQARIAAAHEAQDAEKNLDASQASKAAVVAARVADEGETVAELTEAVEKAEKEGEAVGAEELAAPLPQETPEGGEADRPSTVGNNEGGRASVASTNAGGKPTKEDLRKRRKAERAEQRMVLDNAKPKSDYADPADVAAEDEARRTIGDYKLKTAEEFLVPEKERINADKKIRQMVLLEEEVHKIKCDFNDRLLVLRDRKKEIVSQIKQNNVRITEINQELNTITPLFEVTVDARAEYPELLREPPDRDGLLAYQKQKAQEAKAEARKAARRAGNAGTALDSDDDEKAKTTAEDEQLVVRPTRGVGAQVAPAPSNEVHTTLELQEMKTRERLLTFEKEQLIKRQVRAIAAFNSDLNALRGEKLKLEEHLKRADMKLLTLGLELRQLREFEKLDRQYDSEMADQRSAKADIEAKMADLTAKLQAKEAEIEAVSTEDTLITEFQAAVADLSSKKDVVDALLRIFRRNVSRAHADDEDGSGGSDSDAMSALSGTDVADSVAGEPTGPESDAKPAGCDDKTYNAVLALRQRRMDNAEKVEAITVAIKKISFDFDTLQNKMTIVEKAMGVVHDKIEKFQKEKQNKLNELVVAEVMKCSQILFLDETSNLPRNLQDCVIFTTGRLERLKARTSELKKEIGVLQKGKAELEWLRARQDKLKKANEKKVAELRQRALDVQMLKFGRQVDLDSLLAMSVNTTADELKARLMEADTVRAREVARWQTEIDSIKLLHTKRTRENSEWLARLAELSQAQNSLAASLDSTQNTMVVGEFSSIQIRKEQEELDALRRLTGKQANEIQSLRQEIALLSRKGGALFPPINS